MLNRIFFDSDYQVLTVELDGEITLNDCHQLVQEPAYISYLKYGQKPVDLVFHVMEHATVADELNHIHVLHNCIQTNLDSNKLRRVIVVGKLDAPSSFHTILATAMELLGIKFQMVPSHNQALELIFA